MKELSGESKSKLDEHLEKYKDILPLLGSWAKGDSFVSNAELERAHSALVKIHASDNSGLLGMIERSELRLFRKRTARGEKLTLAELDRYRQVVSWQLKGKRREDALRIIDRAIIAAHI